MKRVYSVINEPLCEKNQTSLIWSEHLPGLSHTSEHCCGPRVWLARECVRVSVCGVAVSFWLKMMHFLHIQYHVYTCELHTASRVGAIESGEPVSL